MGLVTPDRPDTPRTQDAVSGPDGQDTTLWGVRRVRVSRDSSATKGAKMTARTNRNPSKTEIARALQTVEALARRTPLELAFDRVTRAKAEHTASAEAIIRRDPNAAQRADAAVLELNGAREALRAIDAVTS